MEVDNPNYDPATSVAKGAHDAGTTALTGALVTLITTGTAIAKGATVSEASIVAAVGAAVTLGSAITQGFKRWRRNRKKHSKTTIEALHGVGSVLICFTLALSMGLAGCITTRAADGTVTQQLDTTALQTAYLIYLTERDRLAAQDTAPDPVKQARIDKLNAAMAPVSEALLRAGYEWIQGNGGTWINVKTGQTSQRAPE